jgi:alpha-galactosidase
MELSIMSTGVDDLACSAKRMAWVRGTLGLLVSLLFAQAASAVQPMAWELAENHRWATARFAGVSQSQPSDVGLVVLANNDPVQRNGRGGRPMKIAGAQYSRGLYCHAVSKVVVRLPGPGKTFNAIVGVDSNEQTSGGRGSVVFSVNVSGKTVAHTDLMREGMAGVPLRVDLAGASEFTLDIGDGGDGISCDQADWADAQVTLQDGQRLWLGEMPIQSAAPEVFSTGLPFSFLYGGNPSTDLIRDWKVERDHKSLDDHRMQHTITCTDPRTSLVVRCVGVEYHDFPTVEWTLYFRNAGSADTPILSDIQALDIRVKRSGEGEFALHHYRGTPYGATDYEPMATLLPPKTEKNIGAAGGRPTNSDLACFNLEWAGRGLILAVGWPGQWQARFVRDEGTGLRLRAGQELTHFLLHPGEEVRSPLIVLQFWSGERVRSQNIWRRWMRAYNVPRPGGKPLRSQTAACSSHQFGEMIHANEENQKFFIDRYVEERLPLDYWWMDAGWYPNDLKYSDGGWPNTGTWEVDKGRFPNGLKAITDHGRSKGIKSIVWFEPERVTPGTWLWKNHQDWLIGPKAAPNQDVADRSGPRDKLLNLGNPEARKWLTEHVDRLLREEGIDLYRQDFNTDPLDRWRANDAPDRQGITEINYVTGYLAWWDELRRRHPEMLIDSCASGGRRNDLETLRRAVPLLRSDYILEPVGQQNHTYGASFWYPFYGTGMTREGLYESRSCFCPSITCCYDMRDRNYDYERARRVVKEWKQVAGYMLDGDYYPLTSYSPANDVWMAWQFNLPEKGEGAVQAFRRGGSIYESARLKLCDLDPDASYLIQDFDRPAPQEATGRQLMDRGLLVTMENAPEAAVIVYRRK